MNLNGTLLFAGIVLASWLPGGQSQAQTTATNYIASGGSGDSCTFNLPCGTLTAALANTTAGGTIICKDSGSFLAGTGTTIDKSVTIDCTGTAAVFGRLTIDAPGGTVTLRGVNVRGTDEAIDGITFLSGAALIIENSAVRHYGSAGIRFRPNSSAQLTVTNMLLYRNGTGTTGGGIVVNPQAGGTALVSLDRVTAANNVFGIAVDGTGSTGGIAAVIRNSTVHRNSQMGIVATTPGGGAPMGVLVENSASLSNTIGILSSGPGVTVRVDNSTVMHNGTGLSFSTGGALLSAGNNLLTANNANGSFSGTVPLQ